MRKKLFGLIYMSSYKIQLNIVNLKDLSILEKVDSPSFVQAQSNERVFEQDMGKICSAIDGFKEKLKEYKVKNFKFFGNRQLIDDVSASYIADQIQVRTGWKINWLNGEQVVYNKVLGGISCFSEVQQERMEKFPIYILSLGSAMMNLSLFKNNKFVATWNLPLGPREIREIAKVTNETPNNPIDVMSDYIGAKIDHLARQIKASPNSALVIQHADALSNYFLHRDDSVTRISESDLNEFFSKTLEMPYENLVQDYQLEPAVAEHTVPNIVAIREFVKLLAPKEIYVTDISVITGLLIQEASKGKALKKQYGDIVMTFAQNMSQRYLVDQDHANAVKKFALHIFDRLRKIHLLPENDRHLLAIAATVDDVGSFINQISRYEQSARILEANKIIGLSDRENQIVTEITRYQSDEDGPEIGDHHYRNLSPEVQLTVAKLTAILRLATALDASHKQKIRRIIVSLKKEDQLIIHAVTNSDITLERWYFNKRASLFEEVFGIKVSLKQEGMNRK